MLTYVLRRLVIAIPVLLGISVVGFAVLSLAPGDPVLAKIEPRVLVRLSPAEIDAIRHELGLDGPILERYWRWLLDSLRGDFGYSIVSGRKIVDEIGPRIGPTLLLMGTGLAIAIVVGIPLGVITALRQYSRVDYFVSLAALIAISTPTFVVALIFIYTFAVWLKVLPAGGMFEVGQEFDLADRIRRLAMPALILGIANAAPLLRLTRASMLEVLQGEYVTTARAKGLRSSVILRRHVLRNALLPIVTFVALLLPDLIAGAVITEQLFAWPGMGQLAVRAAADRDPALMMGIMMLVAVAVLTSSLLADIAYGYIDPRIRLHARRLG